MKKIAFGIIILALSCLKLYPQGEASNWYFGYGAGLKFNSANGIVNSVSNGQLSTNEGCASMSDSFGNLLFYTDGSVVWNRNHAVMDNGSGLFGDASSTQSAIVVPKPNDSNLYYIFTVDNGLDGVHFGLNYSIVDISANGGLGRVTEKNTNLLGFSSEKITSVKKNCVTGSFWVVTLSTNNGEVGLLDTFHAYEITENGVNPNAVKSTFVMGNNGTGADDLRGYLVLSPDGTKMASANARSGLYLYNFDDQSGIVSNQIRLQLNSQAPYPYGVAFSPNNKLLYVHSSNDFFDQGNPQNQNNPSSHYSVLTQFDVSQGNVNGTGTIIDSRNLYRGALQLGPDGKIYRALSSTYTVGYSYLGVIRNPDIQGIGCNYSHQGISIAPKTSSQGLPPFIQSLFDVDIDIIQNGESQVSMILCKGDTYTLGTDNVPGSSYNWSRDGQPLSVNTSQLEISEGGLYELRVIPPNGECPLVGKASVIVADKPSVQKSSLIQCDDELGGDGISLFDLNQAAESLAGDFMNRSLIFYDTNEDALNNINPLDPYSYQNKTNPQTLYVRVVDTETKCYSFTELELKVSVTQTRNVTIETCDDDGNEDGINTFNLASIEDDLIENSNSSYNITFYRTYEDALLEDNKLNSSVRNITPNKDFIFARVENDNQCFGINEITLIVHNLPNVEPESEYKYCLNFSPDTITLDPGILEGHISDFTYQWSTGETTPTIEVNTVGSYTVIVTNNFNCTKERTIRVTPSNIATIENITVKDVSDNNEIAIMVSGEGDYEFSLNNENGPYQNSNVLEDVPAGLHTVYIRDINGCGIIEDVVSVIGFPKFLTPNNDGHNDRWKVYGMSANFQSESIIYIYDRYGKLLKELNSSGPGWDGTYLGEILPSTDYWFSVLLEDGRLFKGHFSLRR
ncbi:T9SS type B sorting domain-containing protein [Aegicerativicinus sediminis]|uniref:T9SS type B sorting domain-containing protein n=1 Tax=Aegicerativicinus sediminis TaxID=2893202 RepID=UPI001E2C744B|nr:T9SS type B sorting domain-containing protein [Aegicerativicinus sediminis]